MFLISEEKSKAEELLKATPGGKREEDMTNMLLADPLVFLRRWIGEVSDTSLSYSHSYQDRLT